MNIAICTVALGGWYPRGAARMIQEFHRVSPGYNITAYVDTLPEGSPSNVIEGGYDYTAYCAKPFALMRAAAAGAGVAILLDAAFYPIRSIAPLVDHIAQHGYYFCKNGFRVGEWSSDRCLERMGCTREDAFTMDEISSYCVGLNLADGRCIELVQRWCGFAQDRLTIPGPHTNSLCGVDVAASMGWKPGGGRNPGPSSKDPRVKGHRHDQTVLSILAHRMGMRELTERPKFTAYLGSETEETVLVNQGMGS
jgi:hypothetical protein